MMIFGMDAFAFINVFIIWPLPVVIAIIIAMRPDKNEGSEEDS